jgi:hypothetical protein
MKNVIKVSLLAAAVLALANVTAYAATSTTATIAVSADVGSFDNITCTQTAGGIAFGTSGSPLTASGWTTPAIVNCAITANDTYGEDVNIYLSGTLTGVSGPAATGPSTIATSLFGYNTTGDASYTTVSSVASGTYGGDYGSAAAVLTDQAASGTGSFAFYLGLNVPATQPSGSYTGVNLIVAITPSTS